MKNLFNLVYWAVVYRVVLNLTFLHEMNWVTVLISGQYPRGHLTISFHKLETVSSAVKFTQYRKPKYEFVVKFSANNSIVSKHEKSLTQNTLGTS